MPARISPSLVKQILLFLLLGVVFIGVSILTEHNSAILAEIIGYGGLWTIPFFIFLTALFVIFVIPLDIVLLIPLGLVVWGPIPTAILIITGWTLGSAVAFLIARKLGAPVVERLIGMPRIRAIEKQIPTHNLFWGVVLLRMIIPVDMLSYALGLFSTMSLSAYVAATAIGVSPFGFYFVFASTLPLMYRITAIGVALVFAIIVLVNYRVRREA